MTKTALMLAMTCVAFSSSLFGQTRLTPFVGFGANTTVLPRGSDAYCGSQPDGLTAAGPEVRIGLRRARVLVAARAGLMLHSGPSGVPVCIVNEGVFTEYDYATEDMSAAEFGVVVGLNTKSTPFGVTLDAGSVPGHSWFAGVGPSAEWRGLRVETLVRLHRIRYDFVTREWRTGVGGREVSRQSEIERAAGFSAKATVMVGPHRR